LRSLGYNVGTGAPRKIAFSVDDDVKRFLPFQRKLEQANLLTHRGETAAGLTLFEELIRERRDFAAAYTGLAGALIEAHRVEEALEVMDRGYRVHPENFAILSAYGRILIQSGRNDPAVGILEKALSIGGDDPEVWDNLGIIYFSKGDFPKAQEYFRKAIVLDQTFAFAYSNLGVLYLTRYTGQTRHPDDLRAALDNLTRAVTLDPTLNLAFRGLGVAQKEAGKTAEAVAAWEKAASLNPRDGFSVISLASACLESGQKEKARMALENFLKINGAAVAPAERAQILDLLEKSRKIPG
jgi:Flp pilus assembly protein TadD